MKVAISATGPGLEAEVSSRFGRCQYFVIIDPQTMESETIDNSSAAAAGGAGIGTAQMLANKGVEVVLTGNCGPNAYRTLSAAEIQVITGVSGKIRDAIEAYKRGEFQAVGQANVASHFGVGSGLGGGVGRGMGMGSGMGMGPLSGPQSQQSPSPDQEVQALKDQAQMLGQQLSEIQRRLAELDKRR